jgi:CheY-like chemotaxis protein
MEGQNFGLKAAPPFPHDAVPAAAAEAFHLDMSRVVVAGMSEITRVVVARIVERAGLRPVSALPGDAEWLVTQACPGLVVVDGGADNHEGDRLIARLAALRRAMGGKAPAIVLLSTRNGDVLTLHAGGGVDAVVAKPITPERLQPVVERLTGRAKA